MLFAPKKKNDEGGSLENSEESISSIVQFYCEWYVDFQNGRTVAIQSVAPTIKPAKRSILPIHQYAALAYQSANITSGEMDRIMGIWNLRSNKTNFLSEDNIQLIKELLSEVLTCRQSNEADLSKLEAESLSNGDLKPSIHGIIPLLITVDLNEPSLVAPTIQSVIRAVLDLESNSSTRRENCTTNLDQLKTVVFGDAPSAEIDAAAAEAKARLISSQISLTIACLLPSKDPATFQEKQAQALVTYHLHRFANLVSCALIFVQKTPPANNSEDAALAGSVPDREDKPVMKGIEVSELSDIMYTFTKGKFPSTKLVVSIEETEATENGVYEALPPVIQSIYLPSDHDTETIEGTMRRNAACEGSWNVETDSLLVALPPTVDKASQAVSTIAPPEEFDDQQWMKKLAATVKSAPGASSVTSVADVNATRKSSATAPSADSKAKAPPPAAAKKKPTASKDTDATSFFENLLKSSK